MILIDAVFINNGGGKTLLDYLIHELEKKQIEVTYLLDNRIKNKHPSIKHNQVVYIPGSLFLRHNFYKRYHSNFESVLCFGNLPPTLSIKAIVFTYFHQTLYIETPKDTYYKHNFVIRLKTFILNSIKKNTNFWLVQSENIKSGLQKRYNIEVSSVKVLPFYSKLSYENEVIREKNRFLYVSGCAPYKNQRRLINAFVKLFDVYKKGELHLTIGFEHFKFCNWLENLKAAGYPIFNHGFVDRERLGNLYRLSEYSIYPSLTESFGLGIIEAIENGCKIIGADLPYMYAVCEPSLSFDPESEDAIFNAFKTAISKDLQNSKLLVSDQIQDLINILVTEK